MIVVIIAGGSGTRLWPLSTPDYPKHLLNIGDDDRSLLQKTYDRAKLMTDDIYVVSEVSHIDHVKTQLPDLSDDNFIVEPGRRGTAHCILAALAHVGRRHPADEPLAAIHADHYIRDTDGFVHSFKVATDASVTENRMVLVGVEPTYPSTGFGYIEKGSLQNETTFVYNVASFKEKPDYATALDYIGSGNYLWNCGYFVGSLEVFEDSMRRFAPELFENYQRLINADPIEVEATYLSFDSIAIDYALIERMDNLLAVPAAFDWMDVGSFADLHKAVVRDEAGNAVIGKVALEEVENSLVHNQEDKPVVVIGLDNVVVVNTPHGIIVSRKDLSQKVGEVSKRL
ncbi:MAG: mannose-phosphate guanylyltransferase [Candidatus Saccharibacteria bacterium]|nr:mannose-phosphate guanylyltransferase [Candidatus Saccharibacteria bacterium]